MAMSWPREPLDVLIDQQASPQRGSPLPAHIEHATPPFRMGLGSLSPPSTAASHSDLFGPMAHLGLGAAFAQDEPAKLDVPSMDFTERLASLESLVWDFSNDLAGVCGRREGEPRRLHKI